MNRAEMKRAKREQEKKQVKYTLTNEQIANMVEEEAHKRIMPVLYDLSLAFALALADSEDFGKVRISRVMQKAFSNIECLGDGHLNYKDLQEWEKEMGLNVTELFKGMGVVK